MREFLDYLRVLGRAIAWCASGGRANFIKAATFLTASDLFQTAALFLPIKIILMISSGGTSRWTSWIPLEPDKVLIIMITAVPVFYAASVFFASRHRHAIDYAGLPAQPFLNTRPKGQRFLNLYRNCVANASSAFIMATALLVIFLFSWIVGLVVTGLAVGYTLFVLLLLFPKPFAHISWGRLRSNQVMGYARIFIYFVAFLLVVWLLYIQNLDIYGALLSLLLCRQMFSALRFVLKSAHRSVRGVYAKRGLLNSLTSDETSSEQI